MYDSYSMRDQILEFFKKGNFLGYDEDGYDEDGLDREGYDYAHRKLEFHEMNYETRYWGDFRCHSCNRKWSSAATWKGS